MLIGPKIYVIQELEQSVGRSNENELQIADQTVSRKHAILHMHSTGSVSVTDLSSFGTFVNNERITKSVPAFLQNNDQIQFGNGDSIFTFREISFCTSGLAPEVKNQLKLQLVQQGFKFFELESDKFTHLIVESVSKISVKLLVGLINGCFVVTPEFVTQISSTSFPIEQSFIPEIASNLKSLFPDPQTCLKPQPQRKSLFENYSFLFLTASQYERAHNVLEAGGGRTTIVQEGEDTESIIAKYHDHILVRPQQPDFKQLSPALKECATSTQINMLEEKAIPFYISTTSFQSPATLGQQRHHFQDKKAEIKNSPKNKTNSSTNKTNSSTNKTNSSTNKKNPKIIETSNTKLETKSDDIIKKTPDSGEKATRNTAASQIRAQRIETPPPELEPLGAPSLETTDLDVPFTSDLGIVELKRAKVEAWIQKSSSSGISKSNSSESPNLSKEHSGDSLTSLESSPHKLRPANVKGSKVSDQNNNNFLKDPESASNKNFESSVGEKMIVRSTSLVSDSSPNQEHTNRPNYKRFQKSAGGLQQSSPPKVNSYAVSIPSFQDFDQLLTEE